MKVVGVLCVFFVRRFNRHDRHYFEAIHENRYFANLALTTCRPACHGQ
jgi:hypothetical protein